MGCSFNIFLLEIVWPSNSSSAFTLIFVNRLANVLALHRRQETFLIFSTTKGELLYLMFQSLKYAIITTYVKLHEINVKIDFQSSLFCSRDIKKCAHTHSTLCCGKLHHVTFYYHQFLYYYKFIYSPIV